MISLIRAGDKEPIFSMRSDLFTVIICVILTTLSFLRLPSPFLRRTLPGDLALVRLEVSGVVTRHLHPKISPSVHKLKGGRFFSYHF